MDAAVGVSGTSSVAGNGMTLTRNSVSKTSVFNSSYVKPAALMAPQRPALRIPRLARDRRGTAIGSACIVALAPIGTRANSAIGAQRQRACLSRRGNQLPRLALSIFRAQSCHQRGLGGRHIYRINVAIADHIAIVNITFSGIADYVFYCNYFHGGYSDSWRRDSCGACWHGDDGGASVWALW